MTTISTLAYWQLTIPFTLALGYSMIMAPQAQLVLGLSCAKVFDAEHPTSTMGGLGGVPDMAFCQQPHVQRVIAEISTALALCTTIPQVLVASPLGKLSDSPKWGRKPFMLLPILAEGANMAILVAVSSLGLSPWYLAAGFGLMGLSGGLQSFLAAFYGLLTDVIPAAHRTYFFSLAEGSVFAGMMIGPLVMTGLVEIYPASPLLVFIVAGFIFLLNAVLIQVLVPSSTVAASSDVTSSSPPPAAAPGEPARHWLDGIKMLWEPWNRSRMVLFALAFFTNLALSAHYTVFVPYTYRQFGWTSAENGLFQSLSFLCKVIALAFFLPYARSKPAKIAPPSDDTATDANGHTESTPLLLQTPKNPKMPFEVKVIQVGFLSYATTFFLYSIAPTGLMFTLATPIDAIGIIAMPLMRVLMTRTVRSANETGLLLGAQAAISGIATIVGPLLFAGVYGATVGQHDGASYAVGALFWLAALAATVWVRPEELEEGKSEVPAAVAVAGLPSEDEVVDL
ncbi:major facilitator superfamily domain-containing protein [Blastocladiella britannica]|nr:major facilitator superfamily domain-containing protein [Blastocladiella britannica]